MQILIHQLIQKKSNNIAIVHMLKEHVTWEEENNVSVASLNGSVNELACTHCESKN